MSYLEAIMVHKQEVEDLETSRWNQHSDNDKDDIEEAIDWILGD